MHKTIVILISSLSIAGLTLSGCASLGSSSMKNTDYSQIEQSLMRGQTTRAEVREQFGKPSHVTTINGQERWLYNRTTMGYLIPMVHGSTTLSITFEGEVVTDYQFNQSKTAMPGLG